MQQRPLQLSAPAGSSSSSNEPAAAPPAPGGNAASQCPTTSAALAALPSPATIATPTATSCLAAATPDWTAEASAAEHSAGAAAACTACASTCTPAAAAVAAQAVCAACTAAAQQQQQQRGVVAASARSSSQASSSASAFVLSFAQCIARSPLVKSALLAVEVAGGHPPACGAAAEAAAAEEPGLNAAGAGGRSSLPAASLECTLAQLLALHMRARCQASESSMLAALWVLESASSAERSLATVCLESYLRLLALFSDELVARITADWPASFRKLRGLLVAAQAALLQRLDWRVQLSLGREVAPCHSWLFGAGTATGGRAASRPAWADSMQSVCADIRQQADVYRRVQSCAHARPPTPAATEEPQGPRCTKRQRR